MVADLNQCARVDVRFCAGNWHFSHLDCFDCKNSRLSHSAGKCEYKDELPPALKLVWSLIRIIAYYLCTNLPIQYLDRLEKRLQQTGVAYYVNAEEFFAIRIFSALLFPVLVLLLR